MPRPAADLHASLDFADMVSPACGADFGLRNVHSPKLARSVKRGGGARATGERHPPDSALEGADRQVATLDADEVPVDAGRIVMSANSTTHAFEVSSAVNVIDEAHRVGLTDFNGEGFDSQVAGGSI
jgi:hypothetical protein